MLHVGLDLSRKRCAHQPRASDHSGELACCQWPPRPNQRRQTAAHLIEPPSVARHNRSAQRSRIDDSDASARAPAVTQPGTPNNPWSVTALLTWPAPSWMTPGPLS
jgi:hypothetical protein